MRDELKKELFEPETTETVFLAELYGPEPEGIFSFLNRDFKPAQVETCYGDLIIMINALMDYASLLDGAVKEWNLDGYHASSYKYHAERCRKISRHYAQAIGYDYEMALEKCRKKQEKHQESDVGEDALAAAYHKGLREAKAKEKKKEEKNEQLRDEPPEVRH